MLLDRSLRREMARQFGAAFTVLFSVVLTLMLLRVLGQASDGSVDPQDLFVLIGLACLSYLQFILGLALFLAVLMTYARMHRDSEMAIWGAAGVSPLRFFVIALRFAYPVLVAVTLLTLLVWPWANRQNAALRDRFEQRSDLSRAAPGQFRQSASGRRVFFIGRGADAQGLARDVFVRDVSDGRETVTLARAASLQNLDGARYLMLSDGTRYTHTIGQANYQITGFKQMGVRLSAITAPPAAALPAAVRLAHTPSREISSLMLALSAVPSWRGELSWRIGVPLSTLVLVLMAVPLAASNPRAGRAVQLVVALLVYLTYLNFLNATQHWIDVGRIGLAGGLLWLHGSAAVVLLGAMLIKGMLSWPRG